MALPIPRHIPPVFILGPPKVLVNVAVAPSVLESCPKEDFDFPFLKLIANLELFPISKILS
jgi:hypothetical protein